MAYNCKLHLEGKTHLASGSVQYLNLGSNVIDGNAMSVEEI